MHSVLPLLGLEFPRDKTVFFQVMVQLVKIVEAIRIFLKKMAQFIDPARCRWIHGEVVLHFKETKLCVDNVQVSAVFPKKIWAKPNPFCQTSVGKVY